MRILQFRFNNWVLLILMLSIVTASSSFAAANRGKALFGLCIQCHGSEGQGERLYGAPRIAGLPQWYLMSQLEKFHSGARGKHPADENGNRMRPMARTLTKADLGTVAEYVAGLSVSANKIEGLTLVGGNAEAGKAKFAVCAACHGVSGEGNEALHGPPLKMLNDWYVVNQLSSFKNKYRGSDPAKDPIGATMAPQASSLDAQAMKDIATYVQTLK